MNQDNYHDDDDQVEQQLDDAARRSEYLPGQLQMMLDQADSVLNGDAPHDLSQSEMQQLFRTRDFLQSHVMMVAAITQYLEDQWLLPAIDTK